MVYTSCVCEDSATMPTCIERMIQNETRVGGIPNGYKIYVRLTTSKILYLSLAAFSKIDGCILHCFVS